MAPRIAEDAAEEPEPGGGPARDGDAKGDNGREQVDDQQHGHAVALARVERVDEVQLQVQGGREEGGKLGGQRGPGGAEAQGQHKQGEECCQQGPEGYGDGEEGAGAGEVEL